MCPFLPKTHLSSPSFHPRGLQRAGERQRPSSGIHPRHRRFILQQPRDPRRQRPRLQARRLQVARSAAARGFPVGALDTMTPQRGFFRGVVLIRKGWFEQKMLKPEILERCRKVVEKYFTLKLVGRMLSGSFLERLSQDQ